MARTKKVTVEEPKENNILDLFSKEVNFNEETELYEYAEYSEEAKCICIKFDQMFGRDDIRQHDIFKIVHKRYCALMDRIVFDINRILNLENDAARLYVKFNMKLALENENKVYDEDKFIKDIIEITEEIKDDVLYLIESNYDMNLNENVSNSNINEDLQITDEMNKILIGSSIAIRSLIPIICVYETKHENKNIYYRAFREIIKTFGGENYDPLTKLTRIIWSRISQTKYSDKKMWNFLKNVSTDMELMNHKYYIEVIETILPKLEENRSSIKFLDVVLRQKVNYSFYSNYKIEYKPLRNLDNDDDSDERDRLNETIFISRKDEAQLALNKLTIENTIKDKFELMDITEEDVEDFKESNMKGKNINEIQNFFLNLRYNKQFDFKVINEDSKVRLLIVLILELYDEGFEEIPKMLSSYINDNSSSYRTRMSSKIRNTKAYVELIKNNYAYTMDIIEKDNFIHKMLDFKFIYFYDSDDEKVIFNHEKFDSEIFRFAGNLE